MPYSAAVAPTRASLSKIIAALFADGADVRGRIRHVLAILPDTEKGTAADVVFRIDCLRSVLFGKRLDKSQLLLPVGNNNLLL